MDDLHQFVEKIHDKQQKDEKNRRTLGKGTPNKSLPTKQHGTNK